MGRYPVFLDLADRSVLVVGGGNVALRKMPGLLSSGAKITVISPALVPELERLVREERVRWIPRRYVDGDEWGFSLVYALTDSPAVNERVAACTRGFVNSATRSPSRSVTLPFPVSAGPLTLAVGSEPSDPILARDVGRVLETFMNRRGFLDFLYEHVSLRDALRMSPHDAGSLPGILSSFSVAWALDHPDREERFRAYADRCGQSVADTVRSALKNRENASSCT